MRYIAFALALLSVPAGSADFRLLDIGASCADTRAQEIALGSREIPWSAVPGATVFAFEGKAFGAIVHFAYFCVHDTLRAGNYHFPIEDLSAAVSRYESLHKEISKTYGAASSDNSPWMRPLDPRGLQSDPKKYTTTWSTPRINVTTTIMPSHPTEPKGWRVFLLYSPSFDGERSNTSLERTRDR
jgi:hypothetical protein